MEKDSRLACALFDVYLRRWKYEGWRVRNVHGVGYKAELQGQVREHDNTVLLYPDEADDPLEKILLHEMIHIFEDLDNTPAIEHCLTWRITHPMWDALNPERRGQLTALISMGV